MSNEKIVETIYGKYSKFEIVKKTSLFGVEFFIRKDGNHFKGGYSNLSAAVNDARKAAS